MLDGWDVGLGLPRTPLCGAGARPLQNKGGAKGRGRDNCVPQHQSQELRTGFGPRGSSPPPHNHLHRTSFVNDSFPLNSNFEPVFDLLRHRLGSLGNGDVGWRSVPGLVRNRCRRSIDWNSTPLRIALTARRFECDPFSYVMYGSVRSWFFWVNILVYLVSTWVISWLESDLLNITQRVNK